MESNPEAEPAESVQANVAFHLGVAELSGNQRVFDQINLVLEYVRRLDIFVAPKERGGPPHEDIIRTLETGSPAAARQAMASHIDYAADQMIKAFRPAVVINDGGLIPVPNGIRSHAREPE